MSGPGVFGERRCRVVWGCRGHPRGSLGAERERRAAAARTGPDLPRPLLTSAGPTSSPSDPGLSPGARLHPRAVPAGGGMGTPGGDLPAAGAGRGGPLRPPPPPPPTGCARFRRGGGASPLLRFPMPTAPRAPAPAPLPSPPRNRRGRRARSLRGSRYRRRRTWLKLRAATAP